MERESEDIEFEHRFGLLDGAHYYLHHNGQQKKTREEEFKLKESLNLLLKKLNRIAMLFLAFSLFIIVNDCIGMSSQPFYLPHSYLKIPH